MHTSRRNFPSINTLSAFECAARHLNFTRAAEEMNLTQSAISRQIRDLELQLGVTLFERIRKRVVLTEAGARFLVDAKYLIEQTEGLVYRTMASAKADATLSVATLPTFGSHWLAPRLPQFLENNPKLAVNLESRWTPFSLQEQFFDVAIHYGRPIWAGASCQPLCAEYMLPVASPELIANFKVKSAEHLPKAPLLHLQSRPTAWRDWFEQHNIENDEPFRGHRFDQFSMIIEACVAGLGVGLLPQYLIESQIEVGRLQVIDKRPLQTEDAYFLAIPDDKAEKPGVVEFTNWIKAQISHPVVETAE
ncbi:LysR substrate-binding domain-containing protein [Maritalea porphyrae]|uniref:Transcriptional regulator n=1 Tax=Maritalea porphyrae TaxID=880732 RepID=A0ABQ5URK0_9HYPH|nr:LysR substrate-binding domain-containing protein [Maritalea porphyrae]GLQ17001.1 transcriptional regulator [Maritalea porphyrae]